MDKLNKKLSFPLAIGIIVLLALTVAVAAVTIFDGEDWKVNLTEESQTRLSGQGKIDLSKIESGTDTIAIIIDNNTYQVLSSRIERYKNDVEKDLNNRVLILKDDWKSPKEVKDKLLQLKGKGLEGAVLVGKVPIPYFEAELMQPSEVKEFPSDKYYKDLESEKFIDKDDDGKFEYSEYVEVINVFPIEPIWIGRIKPYVGGPEGYALLKDYFDRNHKYRTGELDRIEREMFMYTYFLSEYREGREGQANFMEKCVMSFSDYTEDMIKSRVRSSKEEFVSELNKEYKIASISTEGNSKQQEISPGVFVNGEDIKNIEPEPYFYFLLSCSSGDFSEENYIGGHYLFDGNGLLVQGYTRPVFLSVGAAKEHMQHLVEGLTFGEAQVITDYGSVSTTMLGDPTLKLLTEKQTPEFSFPEKVNFGKIPVGATKTKEFKVTNTGNGVGKISYMAPEQIKTESGKKGEIDSSIELVFPCNGVNTIQSGESVRLEFTFSPTVEGEYQGGSLFYTNQPNNSLIKIHLEGEGK